MPFPACAVIVMPVTTPRVGIFLSLGSPEATAIVSNGLDLVIIDAEHGPGDEHTLLAQLRAARCPHRWIRVRQLSDVSKALDLGANGVVLPRIRTAGEIAELRGAAYYPPLGIRGLGPSAANHYGLVMQEYLRSVAGDTEIWPQIETLDAISVLPDILAITPGPTGLFIGPGDLSAALGHPGDLLHPKVRDLVEHVVQDCNAAGCAFGIFCPDYADADTWTAMGASVVVVGSEAGWIIEGARRTNAWRKRQLER